MTTKKRGFTLLEVLIATGVLFIIGSAIVSLSNTLVQGTVSTADSTVSNLWAIEGLELVTKNRDDRIKEIPNPSWLEQAEAYTNYGWYYIKLVGNKTVLTRADFNGNLTKLNITKREAFTNADPNADELTSEGLIARRMVCIEAVGVQSTSPVLTEDRLGCNLSNTGGVYNDGPRRISTTCGPNDLYCIMTKDSLNKNSSNTVAIPPGSAVKVRAVIIWQNQSGYKTTEMGTMLTNWRSLDQS